MMFYALRKWGLARGSDLQGSARRGSWVASHCFAAFRRNNVDAIEQSNERLPSTYHWYNVIHETMHEQWWNLKHLESIWIYIFGEKFELLWTQLEAWSCWKSWDLTRLQEFLESSACCKSWYIWTITDFECWKLRSPCESSRC